MGSLQAFTRRELDIFRLICQGYSNDQIAQELVLAVGTVKWYNKQIFDKLDVTNRTQATLKAAELRLFSTEGTSLKPTISRPIHNLPAQISSFVGRKHELAAIKQLLTHARLLTLTGPGGVGKTRLALQVASEVMPQFSDGVFFVSLAPLRESRLVIPSIAQTFNLSERASNPILKTLKGSLQEKELLLILDNFEHVIEAAPVIPELLTASPGLKILVTSREVLRLYGEQQYVVPPLQLPEDRASVASVRGAEAVEFFFEKARAVSPDFELTDENAGVLADICARVDGLPLALELAAARTKLFSPQTLLVQLSHPLAVLTASFRDLPARQRTLRATLTWSYQLLDQQEQLLFARLGVFAGGWTLEAAEKVCAGMLDRRAADGLESLLHKSLVYQQRDSVGEVRFGMLETLREFALEQLEERGNAEEIRKGHASYCHEVTEQARRIHRQGSGLPPALLIQLEVENDNLRAALEWLLRVGDRETASQMVEGLTDFWWRKGHFTEGRQWAERVLGDGSEITPAARARTLRPLGCMLDELGEVERALEVYGEMVHLCRQINDTFLLAWALVGMGSEARVLHDERAQPMLEEALDLFRALDSAHGVGHALNSLGDLMYGQGHYEQAIRCYEEAVVFHQRWKGTPPVRTSMGLGFAQLAHGDYRQAQTAFEQSLDNSLQGRFGDLFVAEALTGIAAVLSAKGDLRRAGQLLGAVKAICDTSQQRLGYDYQNELNRLVSHARHQLDPAVFEQAWATGYTMSFDEAVAYGKASLSVTP